MLNVRAQEKEEEKEGDVHKPWSWIRTPDITTKLESNGVRVNGDLGVPRRSSLAFYWHSKKVSDPPLCPNRLTKRRTYRPRSVIYRYVSRQSSEKMI